MTEIKKHSLEVLPVLMSLKDKDGEFIISRENVEKFPDYNDLAPDVKKSYEERHTTSSLKDFLAQYTGKKQPVKQMPVLQKRPGMERLE